MELWRANRKNLSQWVPWNEMGHPLQFLTVSGWIFLTMMPPLSLSSLWNATPCMLTQFWQFRKVRFSPCVGWIWPSIGTWLAGNVWVMASQLVAMTICGQDGVSRWSVTTWDWEWRQGCHTFVNPLVNLKKEYKGIFWQEDMIPFFQSATLPKECTSVQQMLHWVVKAGKGETWDNRSIFPEAWIEAWDELNPTADLAAESEVIPNGPAKASAK